MILPVARVAMAAGAMAERERVATVNQERQAANTLQLAQEIQHIWRVLDSAEPEMVPEWDRLRAPDPWRRAHPEHLPETAADRAALRLANLRIPGFPICWPTHAAEVRVAAAQ
jgi:hypothetical protein